MPSYLFDLSRLTIDSSGNVGFFGTTTLSTSAVVGETGGLYLGNTSVPVLVFVSSATVQEMALSTGGGGLDFSIGGHVTPTNNKYQFRTSNTADSFTQTVRFTIESDGTIFNINGAVGIGAGTNLSGIGGTNVVGALNGTEPTSSLANAVLFYSIDDASGHTIPAFYCEGTNVLATGQSDSASSIRVKMRINATTVTLLAI